MAALAYSQRVVLAKANLERVKAHVREIDRQMASGEIDYQMLSLREALSELGIVGWSADDVIALCYNGGFQYCLDSSFAHADGERPGQMFCAWGADQLISRLDAVYVP